MTGIQEILRVFFFSLLLLHDLTLAFSCTVLCSSSLLLGNLSPFPFQHLNLTGCAKKKWNWQSHPSTHFLPVDYREHVIILNIPYLLSFCFMYLMGSLPSYSNGALKNLIFFFCLVFSSFRLLRKNSNQFHVISKVHHTEMHRLE